MTHVMHCGEPVPEALAGGRDGLRCKLVLDSAGIHAGNHKAHWSLPKLGKVTIMWKAHWARRVPPEVELPAPGGQTLNPRRAFR